MKNTVYVNSLYGSDTNSGDLDSPVKTLTYADSLVYEGGFIVLQQGTGSYGDYLFTKNVSVIAASGTSPLVGTLAVTNAQVLFEGLFFENISGGILVNNSNFGSVQVLGCTFSNVSLSIDVQNAQYLSIHRNNFINHGTGVRITSAEEVCISSNIFNYGNKAIEVSSVNHLDIWQNTIYGSTSSGGGGGGVPNTNLRAYYVTLGLFDIFYKRVQLPSPAYQSVFGNYEVAVNSINGSSFNYGDDFTVTAGGTLVSWAGLQMESQLRIGDTLRILYSEGTSEISTGEVVSAVNIGMPDSRIDSNSIGKQLSDILVGVYFNTPLKIRHNNFYGVTTPWQGGVPYGATGSNFITGMDPKYRDPVNNDFHLLPDSPNRDAADPGRWSDISGELGLIKVGGQYTASVTGIRNCIAPFDRKFDYDLYDRSVTGMYGTTGDIGAFAYNLHETAMGNYVAENGYDVSNPGTATGPYATVDRGFSRAGSSDLIVSTNTIPYQLGVTGPYTGTSLGYAYGRYHSKRIVTGDSPLVVGRGTQKDVLYVYQTHSSYETGAVYVGPDSGSGATGSSSNPYKNITDAMAFGGDQIIVKPGIYPTFVGVTGKSIIGTAETKSLSVGHQFISSFNSGSWTGTGTYTVTSGALGVTNSASLSSIFTGTPSIEFKTKITASNDLTTVGIENGTNQVYIKLDKTNSRTVLGYFTGGVLYEFEDAVLAPILLAFTGVRLSIAVSGANFSMQLTNGYINRSYSGTLVSSYLDPWSIMTATQGTGVSILSGLYMSSGTFSGATGISNSVSIGRKVFAIIGSTGLPG